MPTTALSTSILPVATQPAPSGANGASTVSAGEALLALGWEINANQYRLVHLAARFDEEQEWFRLGLKSSAHWISEHLQICSSTAREWIRVGYALRYLPLVDAALRGQELSYAKARIITRWADPENEAHLLELAQERSANRLNVAIAQFFAGHGETDEERDQRLHDERSFTSWTDGDGMTVLRIALPPSVAKPIVAAVDELVRQVASMPRDDEDDMRDPPADASGRRRVAGASTLGDEDPPAGAGGHLSVTGDSPSAVEGGAVPRPADDGPPDLAATLRELRHRWQPTGGDDGFIPSLGQQRADAFAAMFLGRGIGLTIEVVVHVRGDGSTFDDGTPTTQHAVLRQLDRSFVRLLIHDAERRPVNASSRRRFPTVRQRRVVLEAHGHECVDCQSTELLELDHNPPYQLTRRTRTDELEPRCAPCHRARHRVGEPTRTV